MKIKENIIFNIKKLPIIKSYFKKLENAMIEKRNIETWNFKRVRELIDERIEYKVKCGEKINIVFVCHRPQVWEAQHSIYESLKEDARFDVKIVAIPNKLELPDLFLNHEYYESEGAEDFWEEYGCINGYNYETKKWLDISTLKPDYVFFQQPYNITRPDILKSSRVSEYAKICYVSYFSVTQYSELYNECLPMDFLENVSLFFAQSEKDKKYVSDRCKENGNDFTSVFLTGYPKYDCRINDEDITSDIWKGNDKFKIIWTPRWTTNENNCNFFNYKDMFLKLCSNDKEIEFTFRPHPQAFKEWESTGEFTSKDVQELKRIFDNNEYMHIDESNTYIGLFNTSDCLITDLSSVTHEYFLTGKPIIYCIGGNPNYSLGFIDDGLYVVKNWDELYKIINMLKRGEDPLLKRREEIIKHDFYINKNGAGKTIKEIIDNDVFK